MPSKFCLRKLVHSVLQAEIGFAELTMDTASSRMDQVQDDLSAADAWELLANNSHDFAEHRLDNEFADLDKLLPEIFNLDDFNDKFFPEVAEAWSQGRSTE